MNCEQANSMDMVSYLNGRGYRSVRVRHQDHWYHSPLHKDATPSFKVNASKNTWYDFGLGKGGTLVDFVCLLHNVGITDALEIIATNSPGLTVIHSWDNQADLPSDNRLVIQEVNPVISSRQLTGYLKCRHILPEVYKKYCQQIKYSVGEHCFTAIGFKNNMGGYELRSPQFKGSSSPKFVTWFDNGSNAVHVFEGFFDFLSWQTMLRKSILESGEARDNFLILNSLSFFTRSILLMEKHDAINLWLDNDKAGNEHTRQSQERTDKVIDRRNLYKGCKDLNEWWTKPNQPLNLQKRLRR